ncbi:hypothetical protein MN116_001300 [Schistosoma mekongi]|uniref:CUB domain-containing protein n=1 Tax=Schistosoma mekongi TaxID=38744 RepID=A0AAE1ZL15_SCHME|nr:hypothetical protein MN116_001300 [Schistosoma mekongi]
MTSKHPGSSLAFTSCHFVSITLLIPIISGYTCNPGTGEILIRSSSFGSVGKRPEFDTTSDSEGSLENENRSVKGGIFTSPQWPKSYESGTRCMYRFIADSGEKVRIKFDRFILSGDMPSCSVDFLDVYIDVASSTLDLDRQAAILAEASSATQNELHTTTPFSAAVYSSVLDKSDLLGRYCGDYLSTSSITFISLHREIVLDFYSEPEKVANSWHATGKSYVFGFNGTFEFINDDAFYPGKALSSSELHIPFKDDLTADTSAADAAIINSNCRFHIEADQIIKSEVNEDMSQSDEVSGELISPTYPGYQPNNLICAYQLVGHPYQRISLDILDINLYSGSPSCPKDFIQFYDGIQIDNTSINQSSIGPRICDMSDNMHIVSTGESLVVLFVTGQIQSSNYVNNKNNNIAINTLNTKRRGFRLRYTFTKKLLPVSEIPGGEHVRGTECDYVIRSHDSIEKQFQSPTMNNNYVLTPNRVCNFIFIGNRFKQYIETVSIGFDRVELPKSSEGSQICDRGHIAIYGSRLLTSEQIFNKPIYEYSHEILQSNKEPDHVFCDRSNELELLKIGSSLKHHHYPIVGRHNVLLVRFNSTGAELPGLNMKFVLNYRFKKDFGIPGTMISPGSCQFMYVNPSVSPSTFPPSSSSSSSISISKQNNINFKGWTNSPLYPNNYPPNSDCLYLITPQNNHVIEQFIRLVFETFVTTERIQSKLSYENLSEMERFHICHQDFLEIIQLYIPLKEEVISALTSRVNYPSLLEVSYDVWIQRWHNLEKELQIYLGTNQRILEPMSIYCGKYIPGPIVSDTSATAIFMRFHSGQNTTSKGFTLSYEFLPKLHLNLSKTKVVYKPGNNNDNDKQTNQIARGGLITSPNFPNSYIKDFNHEWYIQGTTEKSRIQLYFNSLELEGSRMNCSRAILRIYEGHNPRSLYEVCGNPNETLPIIISSSIVRVKMHTATDSSGSKGFELIWTDLLPIDSETGCKGFLCENTGYCIYSDLECNEVPNCGMYFKDGKWLKDESDESSCSFGVSYNLAHIGIGILLALILLLGIACYVYCREYNRRKHMPIDPLTELTGAKHSLALNQQEYKLSTHCPNKQPHKYNNSQNTGALCGLSAETETMFTDIGPIKKHHYAQHHHHQHHHLIHSHQLQPHTHSHRFHHHSHNRKVTEQSAYSQLDNTLHDGHRSHILLDSQHDYCHTIRPNNKMHHRTPSHSGSLVKNDVGVVISDTIHSCGGSNNNTSGLIVGTGTNLLTAMDRGLLIREKMQKISIV